jgi:homoserine dehydrogenase
MWQCTVYDTPATYSNTRYARLYHCILHCTLQNPGVHFAYEAAVCGGIPIINALQNDFFGDKITKICGIMNGTTNFMLSKMEGEGAAYDAVLKEAQVPLIRIDCMISQLSHECSSVF